MNVFQILFHRGPEACGPEEVAAYRRGFRRGLLQGLGCIADVFTPPRPSDAEADLRRAEATLRTFEARLAAASTKNGPHRDHGNGKPNAVNGSKRQLPRSAIAAAMDDVSAASTRAFSTALNNG